LRIERTRIIHLILTLAGVLSVRLI
jgi:hypothetical protein